MLSDYDIIEEINLQNIILNPYNFDDIKPASYDVHLGGKLLIPNLDGPARFDPASDEQPLLQDKLYPYDSGYQYWLPPHGVALGHTQETLTLHPDATLAADIAGCSSLGRWWLAVHMTAGFIDPGWSGQLTLELFNASPWWLRLWEGMRIAQIRFYRMNTMSTRPYNVVGHYQGSTGPVESRYKP